MRDEVFAECSGCGHRPVINSRGEVVDRHDCSYVRQVNVLVEKAAKNATKSMQFKQVLPTEWDSEWDACYHRAMEHLRATSGVSLKRGGR